MLTESCSNLKRTLTYLSNILYNKTCSCSIILQLFSEPYRICHVRTTLAAGVEFDYSQYLKQHTMLCCNNMQC